MAYQFAVVACRQVPQLSPVGSQAGDSLQRVDGEPGLPHVPQLLALDVDVRDDAVAKAEKSDSLFEGLRFDAEKVARFRPAANDVENGRAQTRPVKWFLL